MGREDPTFHLFQSESTLFNSPFPGIPVASKFNVLFTKDPVGLLASRDVWKEEKLRYEDAERDYAVDYEKLAPN